MAMVEIDEAELLRSREVQSTVAALMKNPKSRRKVLEAYKEIDPNTPIPELDTDKQATERLTEMEKSMSAELKAMREERETEKREAQLARLNNSWESGRDTLRKQYRYTEDGIKAIEEMMEQKNIIDHDDGRRLYESLHPPQAPLTPEGRGPGWNFFETPDDGAEDIKKLIASRGENNLVTDKMTRTALAEVRGQR